MKTQDYLELVMGKAGQFIRLQWKREVKLAAQFKSLRVHKETIVVCRTGINYERMQATKDGRADGTLPAQNPGLSWGEWFQFPFLIAHKGHIYARIYASTAHKPSVQFYLDGVKVERKHILPFLTVSDRKKELDLDGSCNECFTVKMEDLSLPGD